MDGKTLFLMVACIGMVFSIAGALFVELRNPPEEPVPFEVAFLDWDGGVIAAHEYFEDEPIEPPADPSRPSDERHDYAFSGWSPAVPEKARGDATFTALYSRSERLYGVSVSSGDPDYGTATALDGRLPYGLSVRVSALPKVGCHFVSWTMNGADTDYGAECSITVTGDTELVARFAITHDASFTVSPSAGYNVFPTAVQVIAGDNPFAVKRHWKVMDVYGEHNGMSDPTLVGERTDEGDPPNAYAFALDSPRYVEVTHSVSYSDGHTETVTARHVVDGETSREFLWYDLDNRLQTLTLDGLPYSYYVAAKDDNMSKDRYMSETGFFFTQHNAHISRLADLLKEYTVGFTDIQKAQFLINFVRFTTWYDYYEAEHTEFWRTAHETMFEGVGDCEDAAFLYAALAREFGLEFIVMYMLGVSSRDGKTYGHADIGLNVPCDGGHYVEYGGKRYFYACVTSAAQYFDGYDPETDNYNTIGSLVNGFEITRIFSVYTSDLTYKGGLSLVPVPL